MKFGQKYMALFAILLIWGCTNDDEAVQPPENPNPQPLQLNVGISVDDVPFSYDAVYTNFGGTTVKFDRVAFYMSQFSFQRGQEDPVETDSITVFLKDDDAVESFIFTEVPNEGFNSMRLFIGLDPVTNAGNPLTAPHPLDVESMTWGWNPGAGYKFARFTGRYDSNGDGEITNDDDMFDYHCATDELFTEVDLDIENPPGSETNQPVLLKLDLRSLFEGIDISANSMSHGAEAPNAAIMANFTVALEAAQ